MLTPEDAARAIAGDEGDADDELLDALDAIDARASELCPRGSEVMAYRRARAEWLERWLTDYLEQIRAGERERCAAKCREVAANYGLVAEQIGYRILGRFHPTPKGCGLSSPKDSVKSVTQTFLRAGTSRARVEQAPV